MMKTEIESKLEELFNENNSQLGERIYYSDYERIAETDDALHGRDDRGNALLNYIFMTYAQNVVHSQEPLLFKREGQLNDLYIEHVLLLDKCNPEAKEMVDEIIKNKDYKAEVLAISRLGEISEDYSGYDLDTMCVIEVYENMGIQFLNDFCEDPKLRDKLEKFFFAYVETETYDSFFEITKKLIQTIETHE